MAEKSEDDWYRTPLYYDIIFDQDTAEEADFIEAAAARHHTVGKKRPLRVFEPACGSGRFVVELARRGHLVSGFDLEPAMVEFTQKRLDDEVQDARLQVGKMQGFDLGRRDFDVAHCFVSTFKYILDERGARSHLRNVAMHLRKGGIYLLGFHLSDYAKAKPARETWHGKRGGVQVECVIDSDAPDQATRTERVRSSLRIKEAGRSKRLDSAWDFRTYDAGQVRSMLAAVPELALEACYDFRYDLDEPRELEDDWDDVILVLKKR